MKTGTISRIARSSAAILAGLLTIGVLSHASDALLQATGAFPPSGTPMSEPNFAVAFTYRCLFSVFGCYLAARLAAHAPTLHAFLLGGIGFVLSAVGAIVCWDRGPEFGPHWYPLLLVASAFPAAWLEASCFTQLFHALASAQAQPGRRMQRLKAPPPPAAGPGEVFSAIHARRAAGSGTAHPCGKSLRAPGKHAKSLSPCDYAWLGGGCSR